jgi:hypothetical protein
LPKSNGGPSASSTVVELLPRQIVLEQSSAPSISVLRSNQPFQRREGRGFRKGVRMEHRVTILLNSSSAHSPRMVELAIASVWVFFSFLANAQEKRDAVQRRLPADPAAE